jgi:hypothetical protein
MSTAQLDRPQLAEHTAEDTTVHETNGHAEQAPAVDSATVSEAAAPTPPPSPELRRLHYEEILSSGIQVEESRCDYEEAKAETARLKKEFEGLQALHLRLVRRDPLQRSLLTAIDPNLESANAEPLPSDEWRKVPVSELEIPDHIASKLGNHAINTLGDLQDYWQSGKHLRDFKGIGEAADSAVVDAFASYGSAHPEVFGQKPDSEPADEPAAQP